MKYDNKFFSADFVTWMERCWNAPGKHVNTIGEINIRSYHTMLENFRKTPFTMFVRGKIESDEQRKSKEATYYDVVILSEISDKELHIKSCELALDGYIRAKHNVVITEYDFHFMLDDKNPETYTRKFYKLKCKKYKKEKK